MWQPANTNLIFKQLLLLTITFLLATDLSAALLPKDKKFEDWEVKCGRDAQQNTNCFLLQTVSNKTTNKPILQVMVGYLSKNKQPSLIFTIANLLPLDTQLKLIFSESFAISFKIKSCREQNLVCIAAIKLDKKLKAQIGLGEVAYLSFPFAGKDRLIPISLLGLNSGLGSFKN
jgi:invasion protein IalB